MRLASLITASEDTKLLRELHRERWIPSLGGWLNAVGAVLSLCGTVIFVDVVQSGAQTFQKTHSRKPFVALFLKAWSFEGKRFCFPLWLHNGAFREPLLKGIATAFVLKGVSVGRVCWCRQTGWWLTKVIRLWNLASPIRWYVFCAWKDDSQEAKALWRSPQRTPGPCCRTGSGPGSSSSSQWLS